MNYPRYPEYKPSCVEWLGEVPAHWGLDRMKWSVTGCQNGIWGAEPDGDDDIVCVRVADFDRQRFSVVLDQPTVRAVTEKERKGRVLANGDLLIEKSGGGELQPVGAVVNYVRDEPAVCSNFVARMPVARYQDSRYWTYLHAHLYSGRVNVRSIKQTTGIQNLDSSMYLNEIVAYPPYQEQRAIAAFLDRETARIDALIAKKQQLIELLAEKRTALISQAVTKGLSPDAPMKDSGVEWLGEIPVHWKKKKFHYLFRLVGGITPDKGKTEYWEGDVPWMTPKDMKVERIGDSEDKLTQLALSETNIRLIEPGAVLVVVRGMILVHTFPVAVTTCRATINQDMKALIPVVMLSPEYLAWLLRGISSYILSLVEESAHGTKALRTDQFQSIEIYLPSLDEQNAIVSHINVGTVRLDELRTKIESAIEQLKEYRAALIADAVTGKIDVRGLAKEREVA